MDIKWPRVRIIRPQHANLVAEEIIKKYLHIAFYVSFFGWWKIYELIKPLIEGMK